MTTRFPQLPVLGHVPKKRPVDLTRTVTLAEAYNILDQPWLSDLLCDADNGEYALQRIRQSLKEISKKA